MHDDEDVKTNDDEDGGNEGSVFFHSKKVQSVKHDIWLSKNVEHDIEEYIALLQLLEEDVGQHDVVHLKLANYGGSLHTGVAIAHAMQACKGTIVVHVKSHCYSMAAILALCGDGLVICPGNYLMFHNYSGGEIGKGGEIATAHKATEKSMADYLSHFCSPFLSKAEIRKLTKDQDIYIHSDDPTLDKRCRRHFPMMRPDVGGK